MIKKIGAFLFIGLLIASCNKEPGVGGTSIIRGKVWVKNYNSTFTVLNSEYAGADKDVYIIYGDNPTYGDRVKTSPDGSFEFAYLLPGKYTLYSYSEDSTLQAPSGQIAIMQEVEITDKKQIVEAPTINIFD
ncbi:MAG: hypothetical protein MI810_12745 [Flavobacteriales bacterium]|jgi:hypothetical protein|nr:hypothetical protein [Flavobacteriales bacterium]